MAQTKQEFLNKLEQLQNDYAECKIDTKQFEDELQELGVSTEEVVYELEAAEQSRYEFKLDQAKHK